MAVRRPGRTVGAVLVAGALVLLVVVPVAALVDVATGEGVAGLTRALRAPGARRAIAHTVAVAVIVTGLAVAAGTALALAVERRPHPSRGLLRLLVAGPLVVPEFVTSFGWTQAYGPAGLSDRLAGITFPGLYGPAGIVAVLTAHGVPLAYLAVTAGLVARAEPDLERAARAAGAGQWTTLRTITLPLLRIPMIAGAALVFVSVVNSFAVPQVLGTPAGFSTMSTLVYRALALSYDPAAFTDLTVVALAMVVLVLLAVGPVDAWAGAPGGARRRSGPAGGGGAVSGRAATRLVSAVVWAFAGVTVLIPLVVVGLAAVTRAPGLPPVPRNWTLANVDDAFAGSTGPALLRTLWLSVVAAALVPLLGGLVAGLAGRSSRGSLATAVTLSFAVPGSALAVGVMIGYGRLLAGSAVIILIAYLAKFWALGHRPIQAAVDRLPAELPLAARASGAGPVTALRTVVLPPLATAAGTAAGLAFLFASHELTMSTILYGPGSETFAVVVLNQRELGNIGATAVLALVQAAPVLLVAAGLLALGRRRGGAPS